MRCTGPVVLLLALLTSPTQLSAQRRYLFQAPALFTVNSLPTVTRSLDEVKLTKVMGANTYLQGLIEDGIELAKEAKWIDAGGKFAEATRVEPDFWVSYYCIGYIAESTGDFQLALQAYEHAVKLAPGQADCHLALATVLDRLRYWDRAKTEYQRSLDIDQRLYAAYYNPATMAFLNGDVRRALRMYREAIAMDPKRPEGYCAAGLIENHLGNGRGALVALDSAIMVGPTFSRSYLYKAGILWKDNQNAALESMNLAVRLEPGSTFYHAVRGLMLMKMERYDDAFTDLQQSFSNLSSIIQAGTQTVLDRNDDIQSIARYMQRHRTEIPVETFKILEKSCSLLILGQIQDAIETLNAISEPGAASWFLRGIILERARQSGYEAFYKAVLIDTNFFDAYKKRGLYRAAKNDFEGAYSDFKEMTRLQPQSYFIYRLRGLIRLGQGDYAGADLDLTEYLKNAPFEMSLYESRALARQKKGDFIGSNEDFIRYVEAFPSVSLRYFDVSDNYLALGDTTAALQWLWRYGTLLPEPHPSPSTYANHQYFIVHEKIASIYIVNKNWLAAEKQVDSIHRVLWTATPSNRPQYCMLYKTKGKLAFGQGDYKSALRQFVAASDKDPTSFELKYLIAEAYEADGQTKKAMQAFKEIAAYSDSESRHKRLQNANKK